MKNKITKSTISSTCAPSKKLFILGIAGKNMVNKRISTVSSAALTIGMAFLSPILLTGLLSINITNATAQSYDKPVDKTLDNKDSKEVNKNDTAVKKQTNKNTIRIRFSHVNDPDTPKGKAALKFLEVLEAKSDDRVNVEVYPKNTLFRDKEEMEALQLGVVQMIAPSMSKLASLGVKEYEVFDLPFLFPNREKLYEVLDGEIGQSLAKKLENKGIKLLAYWDNGFKNFSANKAITKVQDFNGLRMRIQNSDILKSEMEAIGAKPVPLAFADVVPAMKEKKIDGTENPHSNFVSEKMYEYQTHMLISEHGYLGYVLLMNNTLWKRLPDDIKANVMEAVKIATIFEREAALEDNNRALEIAKANKVNIIKLTPEELKNFKKAMVPVHEKFMNGPNKDLLLSIYNVVKGDDFLKSMNKELKDIKAADSLVKAPPPVLTSPVLVAPNKSETKVQPNITPVATTIIPVPAKK